MRIYVIHNFYQHAGGEDVVFRQEVKELSARHEVEVYTTKNAKGIKGIKQFISYPFNLTVANDIAKRVEAFGPDVVHIHNLHYGIGPWVIRRINKLGIPIVMTLHNYRLLCPSASLFFDGKIFTDSIKQQFPWTAIRKRVLDGSFLKTFITAFTYWLHRKLGTWKKISQYIVLSSFAKDIFESSTFPVSIERFSIRPNSRAVSASADKKDNHFIYIGRLSAEKGIMPLLEAFCELDSKIKVYGTGPQQAAVELLAGKHRNIEYMGFQSGSVITKALASSTALLVPSICYEGMPMTIIEAFGTGTPVLASAIGILNKMVLPLYTGLHFDPHNKESIKAAIQQWQSLDQKTKSQINRNSRLVYEKYYTLEENMNSLLAIYNAVQHKN